MNQDTHSARTYHERTKHSYRSVRAGQHDLDWSNRPLPFKIYETLEPIPWPRDFALSMPALEAIAKNGEGAPGKQIPDLAALARLLYLSNGVTRELRAGGEVYHFRAASCTGALYHIELYLVCGDLPDLAAGVYHYGAHDHALRRLRAGDFREVVVRATANEPRLAQAPAIVICTDTFWRNTWKYQSRAYRHSGWDNGVILANLLAAAAALELPAEIVCGFADDEINRLLSLDTAKEVACSMAALGRQDQPVAPAPGMALLDLPTTPLSQYEMDYPLVHEMHVASSLPVEQVAAWRSGTPIQPEPAPSGPVFPLIVPGENERHPDALDVVINRRGSSRRFAPEPITRGQLAAILADSTRGVPADYLVPYGRTLNDVYLIIHAVEDLPSGAYVYHRERQALEQLREGDFRERAGYLALEQALAYDAAVNVYYLAALDPILARFGNRGYRAAQLEAGILGGKVYLAAYALGLGATGLTFYDDDVIRFFSPHAAGKSAIFLMAVGHPYKRGIR
ncbi:MAG: SagB/ThcOx family dehydrogenase [Anaerolineae bacterium]